MAFFDFLTTGTADGDSNGSMFVRLRDVAGNGIGKRLRAGVLPTTEGLMIAGKNDDIAVMMRVDRKGNTITGNYIPELLENFEGATVNVQKWTSAVANFVQAQTTLGGFVFNNTNITTLNSSSILQSQRLFSKLLRVPLQMKQRVRANIFTNSYADWGFGIPSGTTLTVPNGAAIRVVNGLWSVVLTYNSSEIATANIVAEDGTTQLNTANANAEFYTCDIIIDDDNLVATVQNTQSGIMVGKATLPVPLSALKMFGATALPCYSRLVNLAAPTTAPNFTVTEMQILSTDWCLRPTMSEIAGSLSLSAGRNPFTGAQLENHTNSTAPVSGALANITPTYTTLGGKWQFAAVAGSVTDYPLFGFTVPVGSRFLCEGIRIDTRNTGVANAVTATALEWAMGFNSSAASLATANIVRRQVGLQSFAIGAAIEAVATPIDNTFVTPEVVESGRFVHVILTIPVATATASQIIRGQVMIRGRFI